MVPRALGHSMSMQQVRASHAGRWHLRSASATTPIYEVLRKEVDFRGRCNGGAHTGFCSVRLPRCCITPLCPGCGEALPADFPWAVRCDVCMRFSHWDCARGCGTCRRAFCRRCYRAHRCVGTCQTAGHRVPTEAQWGLENLPERVAGNVLTFLVRRRPRSKPEEPRVDVLLVKLLWWTLQDAYMGRGERGGEGRFSSCVRAEVFCLALFVSRHRY